MVNFWEDDKSGVIIDPNDKGDPLCRRLEKESKSRPDMRKLYTEAFNGKCVQLSEALVGLMFKLQASQGGTYRKHQTVEALSSRSTLKIHRNVFYIYVDKRADVPDVREVSDYFYEHLLQLAAVSPPLYKFIDARFRQLREKSDERFDLKKAGHRNSVRNLFSCYFSICRKDFPGDMLSHVFIVARTPLHDREAIQQVESDHRERISQSKKEFPGVRETNNQDPTVYLAALVKADGSRGGKRVRLNAHRFRGEEATSPLPESLLFVGPWLSNWEFSVGAAEHDEIFCAGLGEESTSLIIRNVQSKGTFWYIECEPPLEPSGIKFFLQGEENPEWEGVRVFLKKHGAMNKPLVDKIGVQSFPQEIRLIGRALPYQRGQLDKFKEIYDRIRRSVGDIPSPESAIEVRNDFWLVRSSDGGVRRVFGRSGGGWGQEKIEAGVWFGDAKGFQYLWVNMLEDDSLKDYCGVLQIRPPDEMMKLFGKYLTVDEQADGLLIDYKQTFNPEINPDETLGNDGIVSIKCVEVKDNGTGVYALVPNKGAKNPFFAFQPYMINPQKWPAPDKRWLVYNPGGGGDLHPDEKGRAAYDGKVLLADEHSYHLICGTSFFQIKVSGTPRVSRGETSYAPRTLALPPAYSSSDEQAAASPSAPDVELTAQVIRVRLVDTAWEGAEVYELDRSNFALHCALKQKGEERFLKAYYSQSLSSALRESKFYERFAGREAELYIAAPELLRNTPADAPWAMLFPRLTPLDYWPPWQTKAVTLAHAAAIGRGLSLLLQAMAEENLVNFDIDPSIICFTDDGRMVVVDFDNVYPILHDSSTDEEKEMLRDILATGDLPAKNTWLPPEAREFMSAESDHAREKTLPHIGPAYGTYMLAAILLQLLRMNVKPDTLHVVTIPQGDFVRRAGVEGVSAAAAEDFESLLREMLRPKSAERPSPSDVVSRFSAVISALVASERARQEIEKVLGDGTL